MTEITQVRLSGLGGQGVVLAGLLLGQAGAIDGKFVSGSNSYGAQARGSECASEVVLSTHPIDFPYVTLADVLVCMSQGSYNLYSHEVVRDSGLIVYDRRWVNPRKDLDLRQVGISATEVSVTRLKEKQTANLVLLGALVEITKLVSSGAVKKAIALHLDRRLRAVNLKALQLGMVLGRRIDG